MRSSGACKWPSSSSRSGVAYVWTPLELRKQAEPIGDVVISNSHVGALKASSGLGFGFSDGSEQLLKRSQLNRQA